MERFSILCLLEIRSLFRNRGAIFWVLLFPAALFAIIYSTTSANQGRIVISVLGSPEQSKAIADHISTLAPRSGSVAIDVYVGRRGETPRVEVESEGCDLGCRFKVRLVDFQSSLRNSVYLVVRGLIFGARAGLERAEDDSIRLLEDEQQSRMLNSVEFLISGVMILSLISAGINNTSAAIVSAKERGVFPSMARFPIAGWHYLSAIALARAIGGLVAAVILLGGGVLFFGLSLSGPERWLGLMSGLLAASIFFGAMGVCIGLLVNTENSALLIGNLVYLPILFLGNLTFHRGGRAGGALAYVETYNPASVFVEYLRHQLFGIPISSDGERLVVIMAGVGAIFFVSAIAVVARRPILLPSD